MDTSRPRGRDSTFSSNRPPLSHSLSPPPLYANNQRPSRAGVNKDDVSNAETSEHRPTDQSSDGPGLHLTEKPPYVSNQTSRQRQLNNIIRGGDAPYIPPVAHHSPGPASRDRHSTHLPRQQSQAPYNSYTEESISRDRPGTSSRPDHSDNHGDPPRPTRSTSRGSNGGGRNDTRRERMSRSGSGEEDTPASTSATVNSAQHYASHQPTQDGPHEPQHIVPPPYRYNQERYPAYDANARRIGLDHVRYENVPSQEASGPRTYYRPRTHNYPAPNASMKDMPHVITMTLGMHAPERDGPPSPSASAPAINGEVPPPQDIDVTPPSPGASHSPPAASILQEEINLGRTDRRVTTGRPVAATLIPRDTTDGTPHLREMLGLGPNDTVDLNSLSDPPPGAKPSYPYPVLIQLAINGSARKRLTLSEIYNAIEERFEWFRNTDDKAWQGSIRHTLSLKSCFRTISRPITEPGKGNYWIVDFSMGDGNKRPRKRNPRPKKAERLRIAAEVARQEHDEDESSGESAQDQEERPGMSRHHTRDEDDDPNIDPQLRNQGHTAGEGRGSVSASSAARRSARRGHSPYSTPSPTAQSNRNSRSYTNSSSVPTMTAVTSWSTARPSSRSSNHSSYDPPTQSTLSQTAFSSTRSTLHPTRDSIPRPVPSTSLAAPSNWAPYGSYSSLSSSTAVPSISATTRHSYTHPHNPHPQTLTSLSGSTRPYVVTQSYTSSTRTTAVTHEYDHRYSRSHFSASRSVDSREESVPPRRTTGLNRSPDWENAAVPRRTVYENYSESSDSSDGE